jgi:ATP-dependent exoDNAse (exonuclease V) alpha subunit
MTKPLQHWTVDGVTLSLEQRAVVRHVRTLIASGEQSIPIGGIAGTGKTTLATLLPELLGYRDDQVAYCAYTHKAKKRINDIMGVIDRASTIHALIYFSKREHCAECDYNLLGWCHDENCPGCKERHDVLRDALDPSIRLVIVDEASMVGSHMYKQIRTLAAHSAGKPVVIWIGDHEQLGPVGENRFNLLANTDIRLEIPHRAVIGSPIYELAMRIRNGERIDFFGEYGDQVCKVKWGDDVHVDELMPEHDLWNDERMIICGTHRTRLMLTEEIRKRRGYGDAVEVGERVMCLGNYPDDRIFNGMVGDVVQVQPGYHSGHPIYGMTVKWDGVDMPYIGRVAVDQFGYYNPRTRETKIEINYRTKIRLLDFAYVLTCHKAQGSEADSVIVFYEPWGSADERRAWFYTAVTRAKGEGDVTIIAP